MAASAPYALSPIPGPRLPDNTSLFTKLFGVRTVPDLGTLTTAPSARVDTPIVERSWGLLGYGPKFRYGEYQKVRNAFQGVAIHLALTILPVFLFIPFIENLAKFFIPAPGDGADKEVAAKDRLSLRGIATPDVSTPNPARACCVAQIEGSVYACKSTSPKLKPEIDQRFSDWSSSWGGRCNNSLRRSQSSWWHLYAGLPGSEIR